VADSTSDEAQGPYPFVHPLFLVGKFMKSDDFGIQLGERS